VAACRFPIEASHIMMFARAVGDFNPIYRDPVLAKNSEVGGIIAPPTFVMAAAQFDDENPLRPVPGEPWLGSGSRPSGSGGTSAAARGLHAEQHFEYTRPLRPGDVLVARSLPGATWSKIGRRGGRLQFTEQSAEYIDASGMVVVRCRAVGVMPELTPGKS
jgi:acyl dehydratase